MRRGGVIQRAKVGFLELYKGSNFEYTYLFFQHICFFNDKKGGTLGSFVFNIFMYVESRLFFRLGFGYTKY